MEIQSFEESILFPIAAFTIRPKEWQNRAGLARVARPQELLASGRRQPPGFSRLMEAFRSLM
jgi:hypothetical protein